MATIAEASIADALYIAQNAKRALRSRGGAASKKALALVADLENTCHLLGQVVTQTRVRVSDETPGGSTRIVSLHDTDARPIRKGRLGKPVEFGYKAQVTDNSDGIVLDLSIYKGNPADGPLLVPAIARVTERFGKVPKAVAADRGYGEAAVESGLVALGVKTVAIPRKGRPGIARQNLESARKFRSLVKWRTGCEGRISYLKHSWGFERTLFNGEIGVNTWCGWGMLSHNSAKIAVMLQERETKEAERRAKSSPKPVSDNDPPPEKPPTTSRRTT
jgi:IS5 family transposase